MSPAEPARPELFAIFLEGEDQPRWVKLTTREDAEAVAVVVAVNGGNCELLSGEDLGARLLGADRRRLSPVHPLERTWKPGERVELVSGGYGGRPQELRLGTVERIDREYGYSESLVVRFDDGEVRAINPDVMRHRRAQEGGQE